MLAHEQATAKLEEVAKSRSLSIVPVLILTLSGIANLAWIIWLCWLSYSNLLGPTAF